MGREEERRNTIKRKRKAWNWNDRGKEEYKSDRKEENERRATSVKEGERKVEKWNNWNCRSSETWEEGSRSERRREKRREGTKRTVDLGRARLDWGCFELLFREAYIPTVRTNTVLPRPRCYQYVCVCVCVRDSVTQTVAYDAPLHCDESQWLGYPNSKQNRRVWHLLSCKIHYSLVSTVRQKMKWFDIHSKQSSLPNFTLAPWQMMIAITVSLNNSHSLQSLYCQINIFLFPLSSLLPASNWLNIWRFGQVNWLPMSLFVVHVN